MADALEALAWKLISAMPQKIKKASLLQVATAAGIAIDKMRLLREHSSSIAGRDMSDDERLTRLRELVERARRRRLGLSDADGAGGVGSTGHPGLPPESDGVQTPNANYSAYSYPAGYSNPYSSGYPYPSGYGAAQPPYSSYPYGGYSTWPYGTTGYWQYPWNGYSGGDYYGPFSTTPY
jgi:hypothetical protein